MINGGNEVYSAHLWHSLKKPSLSRHQRLLGMLEKIKQFFLLGSGDTERLEREIRELIFSRFLSHE